MVVGWGMVAVAGLGWVRWWDKRGCAPVRRAALIRKGIAGSEPWPSVTASRLRLEEG